MELIVEKVGRGRFMLHLKVISSIVGLTASGILSAGFFFAYNLPVLTMPIMNPNMYKFPENFMKACIVL